ncbi:glycosyl transferase family protein [Limimaricola hongkongensis]|uniref:Putative Anthranilate phosphoribosyltransferase n=1 Tax=Limimaricola hongkongensis DSM 17492 TaxID=1122180 RepID=A0A017HDG6_9RHOB|nr:glycosyl transferase family protein [Limimaricola hongkongensis]EYD72355.1 putative Anthranilate phosphoribosyltransferase [Limimaricola hongkongensis DSM 17492]
MTQPTVSPPAATALAPFVGAVARGPGRGRQLSREEAAEALRLILDGSAAPEAAGALLMVMRYRGEGPSEIAGFADALASGADWRRAAPDLDWPSYAAGRTRGLPWFLLAAKLVAGAGHRVALHGWNAHRVEIRDALPGLGIPVAESGAALASALDAASIAYVPLEAWSPGGHKLIRLREVFGLRSCINTVLRVANPFGAGAQVQGVFHPSYRGLQTDTGALLGQRNLMILKGAGGEFERNPSKEIELFGLLDGAEVDLTAQALRDETRRLADPGGRPGDLQRLWRGESDDAFATALVTGTAALALLALGAAPGLARAEALAEALWQARDRDALPAGAAA